LGNCTTPHFLRHEIVNSFQRTADQLRVLEFLAADGATQTLSTTDEHPFWSVDAEDYISAGDLQLGDRLIGPEGEIATLIGSRCEEHPEVDQAWHDSNTSTHEGGCVGLLLKLLFFADCQGGGSIVWTVQAASCRC
jgi:hypothetical protein